jgi:hypothetical protein
LWSYIRVTSRADLRRLKQAQVALMRLASGKADAAMAALPDDLVYGLPPADADKTNIRRMLDDVSIYT